MRFTVMPECYILNCEFVNNSNNPNVLLFTLGVCGEKDMTSIGSFSARVMTGYTRPATLGQGVERLKMFQDGF